MAFDREGAKAAGWTDEEIDAYLAKKQTDSPLAAAAQRSVEAGQAEIDAATPGRTLTEMVGGIGGAVVAGKLVPGASKVGQTLGSGIARMVGAGAGGAAAELGYQATTGEQLDTNKALEAGTRQFAFEGVGQGAMRAVNRLIKPTRMAVEPGVQQAEQAFKGAGGEFLPHQLVPEHRGIGLVTGIAKEGVGGGRVSASLKQQQEALKALSEKTADKLADQTLRDLDDSEIGELLVDTIEGGKGAYEAAAKKMYQSLDSSGVKVSMAPVVQEAEAVLKGFADIKNVGKTGSASQTMKRLLSFSKTNEKTGVQTFEDLSFEQSQELRSELVAAKRQAKNPKERRAYAKLSVTLDQAMEQSALKSGHPTLADDWRAVNAFYKDGKRVFDNKFIARLMSDDVAAEKVGEMIAASGNVTTIRQVQEALKYASVPTTKTGTLDTSRAMSAVRAGWFSSAVLGASTKGSLSGDVLSTRLANPKVQRTMQALYTPEQREAIMQFAEVAKMTQTAPKGGGEMLIKLTQASQGAAVAAMFFGGSAASPVAVPVLIAPNLLSRMLTNPTVAGWLTRGVKLPLGSPARAGLASRILNSAVELAQQGELQLPADWQPPTEMQPGSPASMIQERP